MNWNTTLKHFFPGVKLTEVQINNLKFFLEKLDQWNKKINLTGIKDRNQMFGKIVLDAMAPLSIPGIIPHGRGLDIGSGAGIPGVIWAICLPEVVVHSIDKREKKIMFQKITVSDIKLDNFFPSVMDIFELNVREDKQASYDFILSRAWNQLPQLLSASLPLIKKEGRIFAWKGEKWEEELKSVPQDIISPFSLEFNIPYTFDTYNTGGRVMVFKKDEPPRKVAIDELHP